MTFIWKSEEKISYRKSFICLFKTALVRADTTLIASGSGREYNLHALRVRKEKCCVSEDL